MINHNHQFIFIHINKCGGTTITKSLHTEQGEFSFMGHDDALTYKLNYPNEFDIYFKFTTVRNPWSRLVSFYNYHVSKRWKFGLKWDWDTTNATIFTEFIRIVSSYTAEKQRSIFQGTASPCTYHKRILSNQLDWITDENGDIVVDHIMRFENLQQDFNIVCDKIGIPRQQLPHKNKSHHKHYTEYYDNETREIVAERCAKDIEYFGYKFGE
jgi:chondroitin 4-sulfotransferase 11